MMEIAAHIRETDGREQSVAEHAKGVATLAVWRSRFAGQFRETAGAVPRCRKAER